MQILIDKTPYSIPFDLHNISIGDYIRYHTEYGRDLDKELDAIVANDYLKLFNGDEDEASINRQIDLDNHLDKEALCWVSFWCKIELWQTMEHKGIQDLLYAYRVMRFQLKDQEEKIKELPLDFEWEGQQWVIDDFVVDPSSGMSFNEIITSKEAIRQLTSLGKGKWDAMPYLCSIFLRKKDEAFQDEFIREGSERLTLMQQLPMDHALTVGFFLNTCVSIWKKTFPFLGEVEEATPSQN